MRRALGLAVLALNALAATAAGSPEPGETVVVGSKNFTESRLLGEIIARLVAARTDLEVEHRANLGGTLVCWTSLVNGEVDIYPEYTGTAWSVVLQEAELVSDPLETFLHVQASCRDRFDIDWLPPFGLENSYALAMRETHAAELGIRTISDLARASGDLRAGFSIEYLNREDGWPGLQVSYGLDFAQVRGMEHALAYEAIATGSIDVIDAYTTDAKLLRYDLRVLEDDRGFYPPYHAAPVARGELLRVHPEVRDALEELAFAISDEAMVQLNHDVEVGGRAFGDVAQGFLEASGLLGQMRGAGAASASPTMRAALASNLARRTGEHLLLTFIAVALAALVAIPAGVWISRNAVAEKAALGFASAIQTIPSLALLAFFIAVPGMGLSMRSAVAALMLYALLPILRNTHAGLSGVAPELIDAARGMGLTERQILWRIQLPLATRTILAGVRTATVISIGVATLAAFIGAGGLGEPIVTGLYLNDVGLILSGALPAAGLALAADRGLASVERWLTPPGLRF